MNNENLMTKIPTYLQIKNLTFGFECGELVEIRGDVIVKNHGEAMIRIRGKEDVRQALHYIGARSSNDLSRIYVNVSNENFSTLTLNTPSLATHRQVANAYELFYYGNELLDCDYDMLSDFG